MVTVGIIGADEAAVRRARALLALPDRCEVVGVWDRDPRAATVLADELDLAVFETFEEVLASVGAVVVAGVSEARQRSARAALEAGLDVLIEPPLAEAADIAHGLLSSIVRAPRRPVAMVAHEDHFDPAFAALRELLVGQTIVAIDIERADPLRPPGPAEPESDRDVVRDLMMHDLQLMLALTDQGVSATQAAGRRLRPSGPIDHAQALLVLDNDVLVSLTASRAGGARRRRVAVLTTQARFVADLDQGLIEAVRTTGVGEERLDEVAQRVLVGHRDASVELAEAFIRCVERRSPPEVGVGMGIAVQEAVDAIVKRVAFVSSRPAARRDQTVV